LQGSNEDIVRLAVLVGPNRHTGQFPVRKTDLSDGSHVVHLDDVVEAIALLLLTPKGGRVYNICAPKHPNRDSFYPWVSLQLGLDPPSFLAGSSCSAWEVIDDSKISNELGFGYFYDAPEKMPLEVATIIH
jgi:nucleoside-diphosphate-sugar epimerase